ncbi:hypothetical protein GCM10007857_43090 [Bradyrhizobium iriomotense]|uniref:Peptidase M24 domain-containing protein n=2 Tax=Bradyrhizobium iriomotense TaxID=441950 RepID=A0ABQ6B0B8_9BRAD|nr:hypothetical protein GCM10007857_43090 [Bradyrhizobium iriomotense]
MVKTINDIVNRSFDQAIVHARVGITEYELYQILQAQIYLNGAETSGRLRVVFSDSDFDFARGPSDRKLRRGDYIWVDHYLGYGGYVSDRCRLARCGEPADWEIDTYKRVHSLTIELAKSIRPGQSCRDVYSKFLRMWKEADLGELFALPGRIGHGDGLDQTEPPSLSATDETVFKAGMIFTVGPKLEKNGAVFQFEEVFLVGHRENEFLSDFAPEQIPVIKA